MGAHVVAVFLSTGLLATVVELTEQELLAKLEQSDPRFTALEARIEAARAEITAHRVWRNPTLSYDREDTENQIRLSFELDVSGRRGLRSEAAEAGAAAVEADVEAERISIELDALEIFHRARFARMRVQLLEQRAAAIAGLADRARAQAAAGESSGYDLGRLELERFAFADLTADARVELEALRRALGILAGDPSAGHDAAIEESAGAPVATSTISPAELDAVPAVKAALLRVNESERAREAAGRGWIPAFSLSGGLKTSPNGEDTRIGYVAGVAAGIPIFDRGQAEDERAAAQSRAAHAELDRARRTASANIAAAADLSNRRIAQLAAFERDQLPRADALVRRAEASYREGERPVFELIDAYRTARDVALRHLELLEATKRSELALRRVVGRRR